MFHRFESDALKVKMAQKWGIPIVNARWLIEVALGNAEAVKNRGMPKYRDFSEDDPLFFDYTTTLNELGEPREHRFPSLPGGLWHTKMVNFHCPPFFFP
jgi:hypothetical protein